MRQQYKTRWTDGSPFGIVSIHSRSKGIRLLNKELRTVSRAPSGNYWCKLFLHGMWVRRMNQLLKDTSTVVQDRVDHIKASRVLLETGVVLPEGLTIEEKQEFIINNRGED